MSADGVIDRLTDVETRLAELERRLESKPAKEKSWLRAVEKYSGDEDMLAIFREAERVRESDRQATQDSYDGIQ